MDKRIYGVLGISSKMANWNADFSGYPKTLDNGMIFGSDKALKYPMKKMWENEGKKVVYIKSMKIEKDKKKEGRTLIPKTLKERYEQLYDVEDLKDCKETDEVVRNLFRAADVKQFGATFAEAGNNISITGAVQIGQGLNFYDKSGISEQAILSPFRDPTAKEKSKSGEEAKNSTIGSKIVSDEAHYFYPFTINPMAYKEFVELGLTEGYTEEDYKEFKRTALVAATSFATNAKVGCENEFALFVETESDYYLPNLSEYIVFDKREEKNTIDITCYELLAKSCDAIKSVEIYYNPYTTIVNEKIDGAKYFNIFTQKEV